jgi:glycerophosphoryl diester phosphodiesterase
MQKFLSLALLFLFLTAGCSSAKTNPSTVTPQPLPYDRPTIVAHRGARSVAPENTLPAAQRAYDFQADQWELDVQESKDGELVVIHDPNFMLTTNAEQVFPMRFFWKVEHFTLAEIKQLDAGSWYLKKDPFGEIKKGNISTDDQELFRTASIPTLREALLFTQEKKWFVNIELKDLSGKPGDSDIVQKTVVLIGEMGMTENVIISSFNLDYLKQVKQINPNIKTAALVKKMDDPLKLLQDTGADAINPSFESIKDLSIIKTLRDAGYDVYVWTINDEETMMNLVNAGVSGIITDYPQKLAEVLGKYQ